jgi:hypothetical protein
MITAGIIAGCIVGGSFGLLTLVGVIVFIAMLPVLIALSPCIFVAMLPFLPGMALMMLAEYEP